MRAYPLDLAVNRSTLVVSEEFDGFEAISKSSIVRWLQRKQKEKKMAASCGFNLAGSGVGTSVFSRTATNEQRAAALKRAATDAGNKADLAFKGFRCPGRCGFKMLTMRWIGMPTVFDAGKPTIRVEVPYSVTVLCIDITAVAKYRG